VVLTFVFMYVIIIAELESNILEGRKPMKDTYVVFSTKNYVVYSDGTVSRS